MLVYSEFERFGKVVKLTAFKPFTSAANALEQINAVSEAQLTDDLRHFLEVNLPKVGAVPKCGRQAQAVLDVKTQLQQTYVPCSCL